MADELPTIDELIVPSVGPLYIFRNSKHLRCAECGQVHPLLTRDGLPFGSRDPQCIGTDWPAELAPHGIVLRVLDMDGSFVDLKAP